MGVKQKNRAQKQKTLIFLKNNVIYDILKNESYYGTNLDEKQRKTRQN